MYEGGIMLTYIVVVKAATKIDWGEIVSGPKQEGKGYFYVVRTELPIEKVKEMPGVLHATRSSSSTRLVTL